MVLLRRALLTGARRAVRCTRRGEPVVALQGSFRRGLRCAADADTIPTAAACATGARWWRFCGHAFLLRRAHSEALEQLAGVLARGHRGKQPVELIVHDRTFRLHRVCGPNAK